MSDFRRDTRVCAALKVTETGCNEEPAVTRNISTTGMFLITKKPWPEGDVVSLDIRHRFCDMTVQARVVHRQKDGVGLQFVDPSDEQREKLAFMVESLVADGAWTDDRRKGVRTTIGGPVVWRMDATEVQSRLRDLSAEGVFIETNAQPEISKEIYIYLPSAQDDDGVVGCQATVVRRDDDGFGAKFSFPSPEFCAAIENLTRIAAAPGV